jgi:hypothetical protein
MKKLIHETTGTQMNPTFLTLGTIAKRYGIPAWMVRRIFERGILPPAARVGIWRVVAEADLPRLEAALRQAGYLRQEAAGV